MNFDELITNRSQDHVTLLNRLRRKPWSSMTASEQAAWTNGEAALGAYNYTDLNRVETAVSELAEMLGLNLVTKTNWTMWDIPTRSEMERYLGNVAAIRNACPEGMPVPDLPNSMSHLTYEGANIIEATLWLAYVAVNNGFVNPDVPGGSEDADYIRSGEIYSGEVL